MRSPWPVRTSGPKGEGILIGITLILAPLRTNGPVNRDTLSAMNTLPTVVPAGCLLLSALLACVAPLAAIQSPPPPAPLPDTEVVLLAMTRRDRVATLTKPNNISNSPGYDNQPAFLPDGRGVLFTSIRGGAKLPDIYRWEIAAASLGQLTRTPEGEYSPTLTPDGIGMSVIRVEGDGTQRLWRFALDGSNPTLLFENIKPVGYHAWIDAGTLALFVLGKPPTLQLATLASGKGEEAAKDIGRSLLRIPGTQKVSFVQRGVKTPDTDLTVHELDPATRRTSPLTPAVAGATEADLAWTPDGELLMAHQDRLYGWRRGDSGWAALAEFTPLGVTGVTRLAVSPNGDLLAVVAASVRTR